MMDFAVHKLLPNLEFHMDGYPLFDTIADRLYYNFLEQDYNLLKSLISNRVLSPLMVVIVLTLYIGLLRHRMYNYIPGFLKRIGLGMAFILLSALCTFVSGFLWA